MKNKILTGLRALIAPLAILSSCLAPAAAHAQTAEEQAAASETYIPGLRLYPADAALTERGFRIAYVSQSVSPGGGRYDCGGLNPGQIQQAAQIATATVQKLPAATWRNIQMKYLLLCSETRAGGRDIGGIPVPPLQLLMVATGQNPAQAPRFPYTLLHELYHLIEMQQNSYTDAAWDQKFGGYANSYGPNAGNTALGSGGAGYINAYGKSFAHEERAEIFAIHTLDPAFLQSHITRQNDTVLQAKLDYILGKTRALSGR